MEKGEKLDGPTEPPPPYVEKEPIKEEPEGEPEQTGDDLSVPVFEDKWSKLCQGLLVIKSYYFPTARNKKLKTDNILGVYYEKQKCELRCRAKSWGMALSPCWWALDFGRNLHCGDTVHYNVVVSVGDRLYKGFTCVDIAGLLAAIRPMLPDYAVVDEGFPF